DHRPWARLAPGRRRRPRPRRPEPAPHPPPPSPVRLRGRAPAAETLRGLEVDRQTLTRADGDDFDDLDDRPGDVPIDDAVGRAPTGCPDVDLPAVGKVGRWALLEGFARQRSLGQIR